MEIFLVILLIVGIIAMAVGLMIGEGRGGGIIVLGGILSILSLWGGIVISSMSDESTYEIETNKPIVPELRITIKDSVTIDTVYVYKLEKR